MVALVNTTIELENSCGYLAVKTVRSIGLYEFKVRSGQAGGCGLKAVGWHPRQCIEYPLPSIWEVVKRRVEFHLLDLSLAYSKGLCHLLYALTMCQRPPPLGDSLDCGHVRKACRGIVREGAIPASLVPLFPPIEEGACNIDLVNLK